MDKPDSLKTFTFRLAFVFDCLVWVLLLMNFQWGSLMVLLVLETGVRRSVGQGLVGIKCTGDSPQKYAMVFMFGLLKLAWSLGSVLTGMYFFSMARNHHLALEKISFVTFLLPLGACLWLGCKWADVFKVNYYVYKSRIVTPLLGFLCFCLGVFTLIFIPSEFRGGNTYIIANMYTLQQMVESYQIDTGAYPHSLLEMKKHANQSKNNDWKMPLNPYTNTSGLNHTYFDENAPLAMPWYLFWIRPSSDLKRGMVSYEKLRSGTGYVIYGYNKKGQKLEDKGRVVFLSNG